MRYAGNRNNEQNLTLEKKENIDGQSDACDPTCFVLTSILENPITNWFLFSPQLSNWNIIQSAQLLLYIYTENLRNI